MNQLKLESYEELAALFKALAEPARLKILLVLSEDCRSVNAIVERTNIPQSSVSRHLKTLSAEGIVRGQRVKTSVYY